MRHHLYWTYFHLLWYRGHRWLSYTSHFWHLREPSNFEFSAYSTDAYWIAEQLRFRCHYSRCLISCFNPSQRFVRWLCWCLQSKALVCLRVLLVRKWHLSEVGGALALGSQWPRLLPFCLHRQMGLSCTRFFDLLGVFLKRLLVIQCSMCEARCQFETLAAFQSHFQHL